MNLEAHVGLNIIFSLASVLKVYLVTLHFGCYRNVNKLYTPYATKFETWNKKFKAFSKHCQKAIIDSRLLMLATFYRKLRQSYKTLCYNIFDYILWTLHKCNTAFSIWKYKWMYTIFKQCILVNSCLPKSLKKYFIVKNVWQT